MPIYRLDLAYEGSGFHGYARQPDVPTVQERLEHALFAHTGEVDTHVAGRTDRGVHAAGQVVSFALDEELDVRRVQRSLNRRLAPSISVLGLTVAADGFHARFSAKGRRYRYAILNRDAPDPFLATTTWHLTYVLDVEAMHAAAQVLVGEHDFAAFCKRTGASTTRRLMHASWEREGDLVALDIAATAFCHQMVRSIVAASVDLGRGAISPGAIGEILRSRNRDQGRGAAPPHGLTLVAVEY